MPFASLGIGGAPQAAPRAGRLLDKLMVPRFGETRLADLNGDALGQFDAELVQDQLAASTRPNVHIVFRSVLRCAVEGGYLEAMPRMPKLPPVGRKHPREVRLDDVEALLAEASHSAKLAFSLAAFAGLRASEIRGLRCRSEERHDHGTLGTHRRTRGHSEIAPPAGDSNRRAPSPIVGDSEDEEEEPLGSGRHHSAGKLWAEWGLNQALKRAQARAEREGWSVHDLRHFFATELFRRGASAPVVQQLVGHADLSTTQRYADMVAGDRKAAIALFHC